MFLMSKTPINAVLIGGSEGLTIGVSGAVNVTIVSLVTFILDVRGVDSDTTGLLFGRLVDLLVVCELRTTALSEDLGDGCCQSSLAMIDVA